MQHKCPKCGSWLPSKNAVDFHMLQEEQCYPSSNDMICSKIKERILDKSGMVHFLLLKEPSTRGDNGFLFHWYNVFFAHTEYYSYQDQAFHTKSSTPLSSLKYADKIATLERVKRSLQHDDKHLYHRHYKDERGITHYLPEWTAEHDCILPQAQTILKNEQEYQESRLIWAGAGFTGGLA